MARTAIKAAAVTALDIVKLTPSIGAEIRGVDLSLPLSEDAFQAIHQALMDNLVIFFRDQKITPEQQKAFGERFGKLHIHPAAKPEIPEHPEIMVIKADENSKWIAGEDWHSDVSCDPEPPMGTLLYMHEVPSNGGGDTLWSNMYAAYDALSEPIRRLIDGCTAIHDGNHFYRGRYEHHDASKVFPCSEHPVTRTHPVTRRKAIFVNRFFTTRIPQLRKNESDALLEMLFRHIETPEFHCRFKWQPGSIAFWDNRSAQHHAIWDYYPLRRYGHRITIQGDKPFFRG